MLVIGICRCSLPAPFLDVPRAADYAVPMANGSKKKSRRKAVILGLGLDSDGHKRLTTGSNFVLMGGTEETHEVMTEKAIKINEKLTSRGKQLEEVSREEFEEIAHQVGLRRHKPGPPHKGPNLLPE
jgi:hypothetical protein